VSLAALAISAQSDRGRRLLDASGVRFGQDGMIVGGQHYPFDAMDGFHISQSFRKPDMNPLAWLLMLAVLFVVVDLVAFNIDGVYFVAISLAVVGLLAIFLRMPDGVQVIRTSLVLILDGDRFVVLETPATEHAAFSVIEAELSRLVLIHARQKDAS